MHYIHLIARTEPRDPSEYLGWLIPKLPTQRS